MKQLRRQYKFVKTMQTKPALSQIDGNWVVLEGAKRCSLPNDVVNALISQGVLTQEGNGLAATPEARSWLKRQHLELLQEDNHVPQPKAPILGTNDTIVRLSRASKGEAEAFLLPHHVLVANRVSTLIERSRLRPNITQNLSVLRQPKGSALVGIADLSDMAVDCRKKFTDLISHLPKDCAAVVVDICGFDKGLQQIEFERHWPRRSAKLVLRMGHDHAAEFWNISACAHGRARRNY